MRLCCRTSGWMRDIYIYICIYIYIYAPAASRILLMAYGLWLWRMVKGVWLMNYGLGLRQPAQRGCEEAASSAEASPPPSPDLAALDAETLTTKP